MRRSLRRPGRARAALARAAAPLAALGALVLPAPVVAAAPQYAARPAPYSAHPRFTVSYTGASRWHTDFHATPPNPGGDPDTNEAHDSSSAAWRLRFDDTLAPAGTTAQALEGVHGRTLVIGRVDHTHVDGLYRELDRYVSCALKGGAPAGAAALSLDLGYSPSARAYVLRASNPLATALTDMRLACPDQGDSIDRILDNYFTPGFSFAPGHGPDRWLASRAVTIPARVLHRSARIAVALGPARAARPPGDCAVEHAAYELCSTGGAWNGVLTLLRSG